MITQLKLRYGPQSLSLARVCYGNKLIRGFRLFNGKLVNLLVSITVTEHPRNFLNKLLPVLLMQLLKALIVLAGILGQVFIERHFRYLTLLLFERLNGNIVIIILRDVVIHFKRFRQFFRI